MYDNTVNAFCKPSSLLELSEKNMIPQSRSHSHLQSEQQCTAHNKQHKQAGVTDTRFLLEVCEIVHDGILVDYI